MGLNDNINKISRDLAETTKRQLTAAEKKQKDLETKENIKNIFNEKAAFLIENTNNLQDLEILTTNMIKNKNDNILIIYNEYKNLYNKKLSKNYVDYISKNYLNWILTARKEKYFILKQQEKAQKKEIKEEKKEEETTAKRITAAETWAAFYKIVKTIILILIIPIIFIGSILLECCKTSSKKRR